MIRKFEMKDKTKRNYIHSFVVCMSTCLVYIKKKIKVSIQTINNFIKQSHRKQLLKTTRDHSPSFLFFWLIFAPLL